MDSTVRGAVITGIATVLAALIGVIGGRTFEKRNNQTEINEVFSQSGNIISVEGSNVTINDIAQFIKDYQDIQIENTSLQNQNTKYSEALDDANSKIAELEGSADHVKEESDSKVRELEEQLKAIPNIEYTNLGLSIDGTDVMINKNNSMAVINGKEYFSKDIINGILSDDQNIEIQDNVLSIGKILPDKANLKDFWVVSYENYNILDSVKDSYGYSYTKPIHFSGNSGNIVFNLESKYSYFKFTVALTEKRRVDGNVRIVIKADDEIVFDETMDKRTKFITKEVPIYNCSLLTITCKDSTNIGNNLCDCIISDAVVYN